MWKARPETSAPAQSPRPVAKIPVLLPKPTESSFGPLVLLQIRSAPRRGYVLTLTDENKREVSTPTISGETLGRVLEGSPVSLRHAGYSVDISTRPSGVLIRTGRVGEAAIEGIFDIEDLERAIHAASCGPII